MGNLNKIFASIILFVCVCGGCLWGQSTLTVCDGIQENYFIPVRGNYADQVGTASEFIIPSTTTGMSSMVGSSITKLTFYLESSASAAWTATFKVYMAEVANTTLSSITGYSGCTVVYTGTLDATGSTMEIELDESFSYGGGNLLIGTYVQTAGNYKDASFKGINATNAAYCYYSNIVYPQQSFIPKTTFTYEASSCPKPRDLSVGSVSSTGATVSWTAGGSETKWSLKYGAAGFNVETEGTLVANLTSTSYSLTTLTASTEYDVYVKAVCGVGDESGWKKITFRTPCATASIPFTETFESINAGNIPDCWEKIVTYSTYPSVSTIGTPHGGSKHLYMCTSSSSSPYKNTIALPPMDNINTLEISFWAKYSSISDDPNYRPTFQVGYIMNGTFTSLQTITLTKSYTEYIISLSGALPGAEKIAFCSYKNSSYSTTAYIDDINVSRSCTHRTGTFAFTAASGSILTSNTLDLSGTPSPYLNNTLSPSGTVEWSSSNTSVATVSNAGLVTGVNGGSAVITATMPQQTISGTEYCAESAEFTINVSCTQPTVSFPGAPYSYTRSASVSPFIPTVNYNGSSSLPAGTTYSSSNTSVATVNSSGQLTVNTSNVGNATITVTIPSSGTYCSKTVTYSVSVTCNEPDVTLTTSYVYMQNADVADFTPSVSYNGGSLPAGTTYNSSNTSLATVSSSGLLHVNTASLGSSTITISIPASGSYCSKTVSYTVAVTDGCPQVGSGDVYTYGDNAPIYSLSTDKYSYTQQLYLASEIAAAGGGTGKIESLKFRYYGPTNLSVPIEIYLGQTTQTTMPSSWITDASLRLVYSGTPTFSTGWVSIDISGASYVWDGTKNIVVAVKTLGKPSADCKFYYTTTANNSVGYCYDGDFEYGLNENNIPESSPYINKYRTNIKFCIEPCSLRNGSLAFGTSSYMVEYGESFTGQAAVYTGDYPGAITYESSNPTVAAVDENTGVVTLGSTFGSAVITATDSRDGYCDISTSYTIRYKCAEPIFEIDQTSHTLRPGDYFDISVTYNTSGGTVTWSSSNTGIATVDGSGHVVAVAEGYCWISVTVAAVGNYCEKTISCNVHVSADDCARVGWGSNTNSGVYFNNVYSYTQQLYTAAEIRMAGGAAGKINSIKVQHGNSNVTMNTRVFMALTDAENLASGWVSTAFTQVYNGNISYNNGWTEITLGTPFEWDGESNIVVAFKNNYTSGTRGNFICHYIGDGNNSHTATYNYRYIASSAEEIDISSGVPEGDGTKLAYRTNIRFCITPCTNHVDAYFDFDEVNMILSSTFNLASHLTVNPTGGNVTYTSSNTSVATVNSSGVVTASSSNEGTAVITAHVAETDGGNCSANASISVKVCDCIENGDVQYQVGTCSSQDYQYAVPFNINYNYGYRQIIYPKEQINPGKIKSIAFKYNTASSQTRSSVTIYMGHVAEYSFANTSFVTAGFSQVYSGSVTVNQGWNNITLQSPFDYNGCDNLLVVIDDNSGSWVSGLYYFSCSSSSNYCMLYYNTDDNSTNPATGSRSQSFPDTKFCIKEEGGSAHTLSYNVTGNCAGSVTPASISSVTATTAIVTSVIPHCPDYAGFKEWNTAANGTGTAYHAGDRINLNCDDITLYAIYNNVVHGESSCDNAVAFCNSGNSISFHVEPGIGQSYGDFCRYFNTPATWWYMQIDQPGDLYMTIHSSAGDVDMACWGPFDNVTSDISDFSDNGEAGWNSYSDPRYHYSNTDAATTYTSTTTPICGTYTLERPCGKLVDFGGSTSRDEYLQIIDAQHGDYYMILVANYVNDAGEITFTQTGGAGRASCDIVNNCDITSITASTNCTSKTTYDVEGEIYFRDAPTDGTLIVTIGGNALPAFTPPFSSPISYSKAGLSANGETVTVTATFTSSTINCSKTSSYNAPSRAYCDEVMLPVSLLSLHATCNGKRALVLWTTASEHNNDYFVVERSDDALNFVEVGRVAGAGNSIETLSYSYADYSIRTGNNYYRLVQVDYDGTRTTSEIIEVHCSGSAPEGDPDVFVYPNPFDNDLIVHLVNFSDHRATVEVIDMLGRTLLQREIYPTLNDAETTLNLCGLPAAAYYVRVSTDEFVVYRKVVKSK